MKNTTYDLGNNESVKVGVFPNGDGTFTAMTFTKSKTFKTEAGGNKWLSRQLAD
ncbi:YdaF family protein [Serratia liquefaciens]|uniref:YdaF family protein n=1 Tax=Serratia liquefaciens TaxID=614 RepID=UPI00215778E3|nr:YdaF family protein [Serratia liquefaciens]